MEDFQKRQYWEDRCAVGLDQQVFEKIIISWLKTHPKWWINHQFKDSQLSYRYLAGQNSRAKENWWKQAFINNQRPQHIVITKKIEDIGANSANTAQWRRS